jgi:hypothetical protein
VEEQVNQYTLESNYLPGCFFTVTATSLEAAKAKVLAWLGIGGGCWWGCCDENGDHPAE